jgi:hypothetical protein
MPPKHNPLRLNKLQLKTLTILQELARHPESATPDAATGEVLISNLPHAHGNRKGLAKSGFPLAIVLTPEGLGYDTGLRQSVLLGGDHDAPMSRE